MAPFRPLGLLNAAPLQRIYWLRAPSTRPIQKPCSSFESPMGTSLFLNRRRQGRSIRPAEPSRHRSCRPAGPGCRNLKYRLPRATLRTRRKPRGRVARALFHYQPEDSRFCRAERQTDTEFVCPCSYTLDNDAVDADRREQYCNRGKEPQQHGLKPCFGNFAIDDAVHRRDLRQSKSRIEFTQLRSTSQMACRSRDARIAVNQEYADHAQLRPQWLASVLIAGLLPPEECSLDNFGRSFR